MAEPPEFPYLLESTLPTTDPMELIKIWFSDAKEAYPATFYAFCLATADRNGIPSNRMMALVDLREDGIVFGTNRNSPKARDFMENPAASICFWFATVRHTVKPGR